ncbi:MAG: hypothetical protein HY906_15865, partial [Deltaproteobacteria bacterium]|nr:hypothetical protein [Deltaproteobacteria bacterium]
AAACTPGAYQCAGNVRQQCTSDGCGWTNVQTCACGCSGGSCVAGVCTPGAYQCAGNVRQQCASDGCGWTNVQTCGYQCNPSIGACCGAQDEACCGSSTCAAPLVCLNGSSTCAADTTPKTTSYRFVNRCNSTHWQSIANACYPGSSGPTQGCGSCTNTAVNPGCSASTCWQREIAFTTYLIGPVPYGSFSQVFHCFQGGSPSNTYTRGSCSSYGDPTSIGWIANAPVGLFTTPVWLCSWTPPATGVPKQFFTLSKAAECAGAGRSLVYEGAYGDPYGYVQP